MIAFLAFLIWAAYALISMVKQARYTAAAADFAGAGHPGSVLAMVPPLSELAVGLFGARPSGRGVGGLALPPVPPPSTPGMARRRWTR